MLFDVLLEKLKQTRFRVDKTNRSRKGTINPENAQIIHFANHNQTYPNKTSVFQPTNAIFKFTEVHKILKQIANIYFPDFNYNWIQVAKNNKTAKHKDKGNVGVSYLFTVGDFNGGLLMTEDGGIDIHDKPTLFDGQNIIHWTGDWAEGDRYFITYFYNKRANVPEKLKDALDVLKPSSKNDYIEITQNFRYDIYETNKFVKEGEVWIDTKAGSGAFVLKCLKIGVSHIYAYETNNQNYDKLVEIFGNNPKVSLFNKHAIDLPPHIGIKLDDKIHKI